MQESSEFMNALKGPIADSNSDAIPIDSGNSTDAAVSRKFIHPGTIELALRQSIEDCPKQGILPIRVAILAAQTHGNKWFSIAAVTRHLIGDKEDYPSRSCALRMENLGLAEVREHKEGNQRIFQARLKIRMFNEDHAHGRTSLRVATNMNQYYASRPRASGLPALLLVGIHDRELTDSTDLRRFCEPEHSFDYESGTTSKILNAFADAGMVTLIRDGNRIAGAFLVIPVKKTT